MKKVLVWHFARADRKLGYNDGRQIVVGETLTVEVTEDRPLGVCWWGLHGSERAIDALGNAPGPLACRDVLSGEIVSDDNKACASERTCLAMADATNLLHELACQWTEEALDAVEKAGLAVDPRSRAAIKMKRKWVRGEANDYELSAAWDAANEAIEIMGYGPSHRAALAAASATSKAAHYAAGSAGRASAAVCGSLAEVAAGVSIAFNPAWDARNAAHNADLERRLRELLHLPPSDEEETP